MDHVRSSTAPASTEIFLCSTYKPHFWGGFLLNFASGLLWQRSGQPIVLVHQESKLCSGESKTSNILTIVCVQAVGQFLSDFIFSTLIGEYEVLPPYLFCGSGVKMKRVIAILSPGIKIMLWGVENIKNFYL